MKNGNGKHASPGRSASPARTAAPRRVMLYPSRKLIEVAPEVKTAQLPKEHVPEIALSKLRAVGDGTYQPVLVIHEPKIRVIEAAKLLHVPYRTLLRLCRAGFVESEQISPNNHQVSLSSWFEHIDRVRRDPEFWSHPKNMQRYRDAL